MSMLAERAGVMKLGCFVQMPHLQLPKLLLLPVQSPELRVSASVHDGVLLLLLADDGDGGEGPLHVDTLGLLLSLLLRQFSLRQTSSQRNIFHVINLSI